MVKIKERLITVVVPEEVYNKMAVIKRLKGVTIQFQVNEILKEKLCK